MNIEEALKAKITDVNNINDKKRALIRILADNIDSWANYYLLEADINLGSMVNDIADSMILQSNKASITKNITISCHALELDYLPYYNNQSINFNIISPIYDNTNINNNKDAIKGLTFNISDQHMFNTIIRSSHKVEIQSAKIIEILNSENYITILMEIAKDQISHYLDRFSHLIQSKLRSAQIECIRYDTIFNKYNWVIIFELKNLMYNRR